MSTRSSVQCLIVLKENHILAYKLVGRGGDFDLVINNNHNLQYSASGSKQADSVCVCACTHIQFQGYSALVIPFLFKMFFNFARMTLVQ